MKNLLVILVTVGIGYAYWYQLPDAPVASTATPAPTFKAPARTPAFVAARTALDEPATRLGNNPKPSALLLGNDNGAQTH